MPVGKGSGNRQQDVGGDMMMELTAELNDFHIPSDTHNNSGGKATTDDDDDGDNHEAIGESSSTEMMMTGGLADSTSSTNPHHHHHRPFDDVVTAGTPADPINFPKPRFDRGCRSEVLCYFPENDTHKKLDNVLYRDFSKSSSSTKDSAASAKAYWPHPYKSPIKTIMGHVDICVVLKRSGSGNGDDDSSSSSSSSDEEDYDFEDEDDVVFETTNTYVAVKVNYSRRIDRLRGKHAEDPLKEIAAMQLIGNDHPNVLGIIEVLFDGENLNVVLPYCANGDLFSLLQDSTRTVLSPPNPPQELPGLSESAAKYWFKQVMTGVQYLHSIGICHRDLSPENVMIDNNDCLIIDMGMCLRMPYTDPNNINAVTDIKHGTNRRMILPQGACGKLPYMSPEIYRNQTPFDGSAADVWTAGTILFCMVTGNRSYQRPHETDVQYYWMTNDLQQLLNGWQVQLSPEGYHLLHGMLQVDPRIRLSIDEVINHPWFTASASTADSSIS